MACKFFPDGCHPLEIDLNCQLLAAADRLNLKIYLVGGYLRDTLMGRTDNPGQVRDFDYAVVGGSAINFAREIAASLGGHFVLLDEELDTARVALADDLTLDFAGCVGPDIESDILRRDFTINALAWSADAPDSIIDLVGGLADLKAGVVRAVAEDNLIADPLRLLRAYRLAAVLGLTIEPSTLRLTARHASLVASAAAERVSLELFRLLEAGRAAATVRLMADSGILEVVFPELSGERKVGPNQFHHLGLFDHSLELLFQAEAYLERMPGWARASFELALAWAVKRLTATKLACLLHDVGKPDCWQITPEGRHTFYRHDALGAQMCEQIARRLRWAKPVERFIVKLVRWHLRPGQLFHQGEPTDRAVNRYFRIIGPEVPELTLLALADLGATRGEALGLQARREVERSYFELLKRYYVYKEQTGRQQRLLDGRQVMELLGLEQGPYVGEILGALAEAQDLGEVTDGREARDFVKQYFANRPQDKNDRLTN